MKQINHHFDIIIRKKSNFKSKHWWLKNLALVRSMLLKVIKKKRIHKLIKHASLCLVITNDKEIKILNKKFRNRNKPTDVLSFHISKDKQLKQKFLGDIAISTDTAKEKAIKLNITLEEMLIALLIHGYLHLLSYDHKQKKDAIEMFKLQDKIFSALILSQ